MSDWFVEGNGEGEWLERIAKDCHCCHVCWERPCGGCQQGAPCDMMPCRCDDDHGADDDGDDDDWPEDDA